STTNPNVACDRMNIDRVPTYADRIHEMCRTRPRLMLGRHLLFRDCLDGTDSPAFPNIRMLRQSVFAAHYVRPQHQLGGAVALAAGWSLGLSPICKSEAHSLGIL